MAFTNTNAQIIQLLCSSMYSNEKSVNPKAATDNIFHRKYNSNWTAQLKKLSYLLSSGSAARFKN